MWIPTQYVCLLVAILLAESGALFIYTLIGLLKSNPLPIPLMSGPPVPDWSMCKVYFETHGQQPSGQQPHQIALDAPDLQANTVVFTSTSVVFVTSAPAPTAPPGSSPSGSQASSAGQSAAASEAIAALREGIGGGNTATVTSNGSTISGSSGTATTTASPSGTQSQGGSSGSATGTTSPSPLVVTDISFVTSHVGDGKPPPTITSVVVVTPTASHA